ncbi:MAG: amidohydrolase [Tissierellia bacterium]|nr:amidohydrolase [Tissierellia bacterium]
MKKILFNAKIYVDEGQFQEAILIENDRIVALGNNDEILEMEHDQALDCQGKTLIPGINDAHVHLMMISELSTHLQLLGSKSLEDILQKGKNFIAENPGLDLLYGMGWNYADFTEGEKRNLTRKDLDKISKEIPVIFTRACGHMISCNSKALELAGINKDSPQVPGGLFDVDEEGPTGCFYENANSLIDVLRPPFGKDKLKSAMKDTMNQLLSQGVTTVHSNDCGLSMDPAEFFDFFDDFYPEKSPYPRVHHQMCFSTPEEFDHYATEKLKTSPASEKRTWGPLKLFKDGSLGGHSALVKEAYLDNEKNFGVDVLPMEKARPFIDVAKRHGIQVLTHTIGDLAMEETMEVYAPAEAKDRWGLVHCQITDEEMIEKIAEKDFLAIIQPIFLRSDIEALKGAISEDLQRTSYAWKSMLNKGVRIAMSTDSPVEAFNPFENIYCSMERKDLLGNPSEGFQMQEVLTLEEALDGYTLGSAYAEFREGEKGRLKPGYLADMILLDRDIFEIEAKEIMETKVLMTMVGGEVLYERKDN